MSWWHGMSKLRTKHIKVILNSKIVIFFDLWQVFTSMALFNMLISPLNAFPWVLNGLMEAWVSVKRIQAFLSLDNLDLTGYYQQLDYSGIGESKSIVYIHTYIIQIFRQTMVLRVSACSRYDCTFLYNLCLVVSKPPEVLIRNGHFTWRQQEEPGEEERVFSTTGELTNINFCIEAVSSCRKFY